MKGDIFDILAQIDKDYKKQEKKHVGATFRLHKSAKQYKLLVNVFNKETLFIVENLKNRSNLMIWRRMLVRSTFSQIEAICNRFMEAAKFASKVLGNDLTAAEISMIDEENYSLDNDGKVDSKPAFQTTKSRLKFAFRIFCKAHGITDFKLNLGDKGWFSYTEALKVRHRLTHPKSMSSLKVTRKDEEDSLLAVSWFIGEASRMLQKSNKIYERTIRKDMKIGQELKAIVNEMNVLVEKQKKLKGLAQSKKIAAQLEIDQKEIEIQVRLIAINRRRFG